MGILQIMPVNNMVSAIRIQINANGKQAEISWWQYPQKNVSWRWAKSKLEQYISSFCNKTNFFLLRAVLTQS